MKVCCLLTQIWFPSHLLANLVEVVSSDLSRAINIKQLEDLSVDVVARELSDVAIFRASWLLTGRAAEFVVHVVAVG